MKKEVFGGLPCGEKLKNILSLLRAGKGWEGFPSYIHSSLPSPGRLRAGETSPVIFNRNGNLWAGKELSWKLNELWYFV